MKVLLLIGPQGSGNHLWSKIFSLHSDVLGWKNINDAYWIGHKYEPHSSLWKDMTLWESYNFAQNTVVSVSIPFAINGITTFPDIHYWKKTMIKRKIDHKICVITRDKNINYLQNERVRPVNNYINSLQYINTLDIDYFLSTETLLIYKDKYLKQLSNQLDFPIDYNNINIYNILIQSFNEKYIKYIENYWLDEEVKNASGYQ